MKLSIWPVRRQRLPLSCHASTAALGCLLFIELMPPVAGLRSRSDRPARVPEDHGEAEACARPLPQSRHTSEDDPEPAVTPSGVPGRRVQMPPIEGMKYLLFLPTNWTPGGTEQFPLVVFLHGSGDGKFSVMCSQSLPRLLAQDQSTSFDSRTCWCLQTRFANVTAKRETAADDHRAFLDQEEALQSPLADCDFAETFGAIVVMPQGWLPQDRHSGWDDRKLQRVQTLTRHVLREYRGDPTRVVLTGQSAGGNGAWRFASARPLLWAAVNVICAPAGWKVPSLLGGVPVWVVGDESDGYRGNDEAVEALKRRQRGIVRYTRYTEAPAPPDPKYRHMKGHASYDLFYRDPRFWEWAFEQRNPGAVGEWAL